MVWGSLVRGRFKESLQVGEKDVAAAVEAKGDDKQEGEAFEYQMRPIVLIVPRGSPPAVIDARRKEAEALRGRVQTCEEANALVQVHAKRRDTRHRRPRPRPTYRRSSAKCSTRLRSAI